MAKGLPQVNNGYYYVTGPVDCFIRIPKRGAGPFVGPAQLQRDPAPIRFLGHTEKSPEPQFEPKYKPVFSSRSGEAIPDDKIYLGSEVKLILPLAHFDFDAIRALQATPRYSRNAPPGTETFYDVGTLLQRNGLGFELWLRNAFYGSPNAAAYPNLPPGYYFLCCNTASIYPKNLTRDSAMALLMIEANWVHQAGSGGVRVCYTDHPSYFKQLPPAP